MRAEDHIDPGCAADDLASVFLSKAAADRDLHARPGLLGRQQVPETAVEAVIGILPYSAGVEDHDIGCHVIGRPHVAGAFEQAGDRSESCTFIWHPWVRIWYVDRRW